MWRNVDAGTSMRCYFYCRHPLIIFIIAIFPMPGIPSNLWQVKYCRMCLCLTLDIFLYLRLVLNLTNCTQRQTKLGKRIVATRGRDCVYWGSPFARDDFEHISWTMWENCQRKARSSTGRFVISEHRLRTACCAGELSSFPVRPDDLFGALGPIWMSNKDMSCRQEMAFREGHVCFVNYFLWSSKGITSWPRLIVLFDVRWYSGANSIWRNFVWESALAQLFDSLCLRIGKLPR